MKRDKEKTKRKFEKVPTTLSKTTSRSDIAVHSYKLNKNKFNNYKSSFRLADQTLTKHAVIT